MGTKIGIIRRTTYDFGDLAPGGSQTLVLRRSIPADLPRGTLMVRVHALSVGGGSDGDVVVSVRADGFTTNDPSQLFFGETLASVTVAADGDTAPGYFVETFGVSSDHLMVQLEATQDASSSLALSVRISVDLLLDDAPLDDTWTPAALDAAGWWRADLGHALVDSDPVPSWANQGAAGADADLGQGTSTLQPTFVESHASFNGQAVIDFDGGDVLYAAAGPWWEQTADGESLTIVAVARVTAGGVSAVSYTQTATTYGGFNLAINTSGAGRWYVYDQGAAASIVMTYTGNVQDAVEVLGAVYEGAVSPTNDVRAMWLDGSFVNSGANDLGVIAASTDRPFSVGGGSPTAGNLTGQIAELLYLKRLLTAAEDADLTQYLNARYSLSLTGVTQ